VGEYDPYQDATNQGIEVIHRPIRTANGFWIPDRNLIVIRTGLRAVHDRSTLAHELAHAALGHRTSSPKAEVQADRLASANLIDLDECRRLMEWVPDAPRLANELGVSQRLLRVFLNVNRLVG
jgi:Zn-dependent peptidase ImmA (M78 family)